MTNGRRRVVHLVEAGRHPSVELPPRVASELVRRNLATVTPTPVSGVYDVIAGNVCGALVIDDVRFIIQPKYGMPSLMQLLAYGASGAHIDLAQGRLGFTDVVTAVATVYATVLDEATGEGLVSGYRDVDERSPVLRGRLRIGDQIAHHYAHLHPLEVSYQEFDADIPANQVLATALDVILRQLPAGSTADARAQLVRLRPRFAAVHLLVPGVRPYIPPNRLLQRYAEALSLAQLILDGCGWDLADGNSPSRGFILQTWRVFESAVARALEENPLGDRPSVQQSRRFIEGHPHTLRPDIILCRGGRVVTVLDTKFKSVAPTSDDLYQLVTYATVYGVADVHLIYAAQDGSEQPQRRLPVIGTNITIHTHVVNVGVDVAQFVRSVQALGLDTEVRPSSAL